MINFQDIILMMIILNYYIINIGYYNGELYSCLLNRGLHKNKVNN